MLKNVPIALQNLLDPNFLGVNSTAPPPLSRSSAASAAPWRPRSCADWAAPNRVSEAADRPVLSFCAVDQWINWSSREKTTTNSSSSSNNHHLLILLEKNNEHPSSRPAGPTWRSSGASRSRRRFISTTALENIGRRDRDELVRSDEFIWYADVCWYILIHIRIYIYIYIDLCCSAKFFEMDVLMLVDLGVSLANKTPKSAAGQTRIWHTRFIPETQAFEGKQVRCSWLLQIFCSSYIVWFLCEHGPILQHRRLQKKSHMFHEVHLLSRPMLHTFSSWLLHWMTKVHVQWIELGPFLNHTF